jgi:hypothetical protein
MTPEFIETLSKKSAYKYYNTSHYDDLVSEGILAAYEEMAERGAVSEQRIYQVINWAQWKFLNVDCLPVHMPEKLVRIVKGLGKNHENSGWSDEENLKWAEIIISQGQMQSDHHDVDQESDQEQKFSKSDLLDNIWDSAKECLTEEEYGLFHDHFEAGLDQKSLGTMREVSQQSVSLKLLKINEKVRKHVVNKKWGL